MSDEIEGTSELPDNPIEPLAPPTTLFNVNYLNDDQTPGQRLGGSYDNQSSVMIMCAVYNVIQRSAPVGGRVISVFDDTGTMVAFIGNYGGGN